MWSLSTTDQPNAPIGVFDSGLGGLTVLDELVRAMPHERFIFVGDSARCPYGPRDPHEVRGFVLEMCDYLRTFGCKMIVIACNTATAAGLMDAQRAYDVPVVGVVEPGARAAAHMTHTRRVGVIATEGTIGQGAYENAITHLDAGISVFSRATPEFVRIAEARFADGLKAPIAKEDALIMREHLQPLRERDIDALVLGCTHYPLLQDAIAAEMGAGVTLVSSAEETAREVRSILERRGDLAPDGAPLEIDIKVTGDDAAKFAKTAEGILGVDVTVERVELMRGRRR